MLRLYPLRRSFSLDIAPDDSNSNFLQNSDDVTGDQPPSPPPPPTTSSTVSTNTVTGAGSLASTVMTQLSPTTSLPVSNHISAAHQILLNKQPHTPLLYSNMGWTPVGADIDDAIAADFDGSFSGLGMDLASASPFMSDALLALPNLSDKLKQHHNAYHNHHHQHLHGTNPGSAVEYLTALNAAGNSLSAMVRSSGELAHLHHHSYHHTTSDRFVASTSPTPSGQSASSGSETIEPVSTVSALLLGKKGSRIYSDDDNGTGPGQFKRFCPNGAGVTGGTTAAELAPNFHILLKTEPTEGPQHECNEHCFNQGHGCHLRHSSSVPDLRLSPAIAAAVSGSNVSSPQGPGSTSTLPVAPVGTTLFSQIIQGSTGVGACFGPPNNSAGQASAATGAGTQCSSNNYLDLSARSSKFQYVLAASTSMAVKLQEETLTYLNQAQSYEIKLKRVGDLSEVKGKVLKTIIRLCFYDRRLQYNERDLIDEWRLQRPNERVMEVDIPLSYGINDVKNDPNFINRIEFTWDPTKETGVFIKINSISTEFTPKKHGGEKGVPFRIVIETYGRDSSKDSFGECLHVASCQVKVFKPKGADRKHKTDREKMSKKAPSEQEKYQNSLDCTVFTDCSLDAFKICYQTFNQSTIPSSISGSSTKTTDSISNCNNNGNTANKSELITKNSLPSIYQQGNAVSPSGSEKSILNGYDVISNNNNNNNNSNNNNSTTSTSVTATTSTSVTQSTNNFNHEQQICHNNDNVAIDLAFNNFPYNNNNNNNNGTAASSTSSSGSGMLNNHNILLPSANVDETQKWLKMNRFEPYSNDFIAFTGADLLRLNREDFVNICGLADGLRLFNCLHSKTIKPKLTILLNFADYEEDIFYALYLDQLTVTELQAKMTADLINTDRLKQICLLKSSGIKVLVTDDVIRNLPDESIFTVEIQKDFNDDLQMLLRPH